MPEPEQPAKRLPVGFFGNIVQSNGFHHQQGIGADAAGGKDHADTAHCQYRERIRQAKPAGFIYRKKTAPGAEQVQKPDHGGIDKKQRLVFQRANADEAVPYAGKDLFEFLNQVDMSEPAEDNFQYNKKNDDCRDQDNDFMVGGLTIFVLEKRVYISLRQRADNIELEYKSESENDEQANHIKSSFRNDGAHQLLRRYFLITRQDGAFDHFTEAGSAKVDENIRSSRRGRNSAARDDSPSAPSAGASAKRETSDSEEAAQKPGSATSNVPGP